MTETLDVRKANVIQELERISTLPEGYVSNLDANEFTSWQAENEIIFQEARVILGAEFELGATGDNPSQSIPASASTTELIQALGLRMTGKKIDVTFGDTSRQGNRAEAYKSESKLNIVIRPDITGNGADLLYTILHELSHCLKHEGYFDGATMKSAQEMEAEAIGNAHRLKAVAVSQGQNYLPEQDRFAMIKYNPTPAMILDAQLRALLDAPIAFLRA